MADPPWAYEQSRIVTTSKTASTRPEASAQYPTMTVDELCALDVAALAEDDAHLYVWTTNPILPDAFRVVRAWGFTYRTTITWRKQGTMGMGYYFRGETEHVLFGTRGQTPILPAVRQRNWFEAPKRGHSIKPDCFMDMVERVSPAPWAELFARRARERGLMRPGDVIGGRFVVARGPVAIQGLEGCTDQRCTRLIDRESREDVGCFGYHCPDCLARTGMTGHKCPKRGEAPNPDAPTEPRQRPSRGRNV